MSKLTELIEELCPDGVEYRPLGELGKRNKGMVITASRMKELHHEGGEVRIFAGGYTIADVDRDDLPGEAVIDVPSIIVKSRGNIGFEYHTRPFTHKNELWSYTLDDPDVDQKFIFYYLQSRVSYFQLKAKSGKLPQIGVRDTDQFSVPTPPLKVQQEIVRVLDAFTDLEQSLVSELELRKKQLAVLHEGLLEEVADQSELLSLESVCSQILAGGDKPKDCVKSQTSPTEERPFPVFSNGTGRDSLYGYSSECRVNAEAVTIAARGSVGHHAVRAAGFTPIIRLITLIPNSEVISAKYLNCALDTLSIDGTSGGISQLTVPMVKKLSIPVPSLEDQAAVVAKLDSLEALIGSIEQEISLRRQQYEFYRDELLSFAPEED